MPKVTETYIRRRAARHLEKGAWSSSARAPATLLQHRHTAAALAPTRSTPKWSAKATNVDGIYTADPKKGPPPPPIRAHQLPEVLEGAEGDGCPTIALCMDNKLPSSSST